MNTCCHGLYRVYFTDTRTGEGEYTILVEVDVADVAARDAALHAQIPSWGCYVASELVEDYEVTR